MVTIDLTEQGASGMPNRIVLKIAGFSAQTLEPLG
jgi:hypothetical protein